MQIPTSEPIGSVPPNPMDAAAPNKYVSIMELIDGLTEPSERDFFFDRLRDRYCIDCGWKREGKRCYCTADC